MQKTIAITVAAIMLAAVPGITAIDNADGRDGNTSVQGYVPGVGITIWCSKSDHNLAPIGEPEEYYRPPENGQEADPIERAENETFRQANAYLSWSFSGEPECAPADANNVARENTDQQRTTQGFGGVAFMVYEEDKGGFLTATINDDLFGNGQSWQELYAACKGGDCGEGKDDPGEVAAEGCGNQDIQIPERIANHWQSKTDEPRFISWDIVDPVAVAADLTYCFASSGFITGQFD